MNLKCSYYKNAFDNTGTVADVMFILDQIRTGRWSEQIMQIRASENEEHRSCLKQSLPACTFSGIFSPTKLDSNIKKYNYMVTVDVDSGNKKLVEKVQDQTREDPFCFASFISPSYGLKCLYAVGEPKEHHKMYSFKEIEKYFKDCYGLEIDPSGKNLARLCFMSYDPNIHINEKAMQMPIPVEKYKAEEMKRVRIHQGDPSMNMAEIFSIARKWVEDKGVFYRKGSRNDYIHNISCILNRAGLSKDDCIMMIATNHTINEKMWKEMIVAVKGVYNRNSHEFGTHPIRTKRNKNQNTLL